MPSATPCSATPAGRNCQRKTDTAAPPPVNPTTEEADNRRLALAFTEASAPLNDRGAADRFYRADEPLGRVGTKRVVRTEHVQHRHQRVSGA